MRDAIISYCDLSGSIGAVIAAENANDPIVRNCNYNEFTGSFSQILEEAKKEKLGTIYIISFILRKYHINQLISIKNRFEKVVYISHNHDEKVVDELKRHDWFVCVDYLNTPRNTLVSSADMTRRYFGDKSDISWLRIAAYAAVWTMYDLDVTDEKDIKMMYIARALNDVFTDFSKQCNGVIRRGRYFQLMSKFLKYIAIKMESTQDTAIGYGHWFETMIYSDLHEVYNEYITCFSTQKASHLSTFKQIGETLQEEMAYSSNTQRMCLLTSAVAAATISYEGATSDELVEIIGTRVYIPFNKVSMAVLSHLLHTFNLVDAAAIFYPGNKVELRSNKACTDIDVGAIAMEFGGGGQKAAAGFTTGLRGAQLDDLRKDIVSKLARQLVAAQQENVT